MLKNYPTHKESVTGKFRDLSFLIDEVLLKNVDQCRKGRFIDTGSAGYLYSLLCVMRSIKEEAWDVADEYTDELLKSV